MAERKQPPGPATAVDARSALEQRLARLEQRQTALEQRQPALPAPVLKALARLCATIRTNNRAFRFYQSLAKRLQGTTRGPLVDVVEAMREE